MEFRVNVLLSGGSRNRGKVSHLSSSFSVHSVMTPWKGSYGRDTAHCEEKRSLARITSCALALTDTEEVESRGRHG